jgi:hypothetical protein
MIAQAALADDSSICEICEHLGLRHTIESQQFSELAKRTDIADLSDRLERTIGVGEPTPTP